jgi:hypothetical protein
MTEHKSIYAALAAAQQEFGQVTKGSVNPAFKSKYADLADVAQVVIPTLNKHGCAVLHYLTGEQFQMMRTEFVHWSTDTKLACDVPLIFEKNNMQGMKSATTYAKRIGLESLSGIAPEDDDGNAASKKSNKPAQATDSDRDDANDWIECMDQCQSVDELAAYFKTIWDDVKVKPTEIMNLVVAAKDSAKKKLAGGQ